MNTNCKIKDKCFRFLAKPDEFYQAYIISDNKEVSSPDECDMYYECKDKKELDEFNRYWR